MKAEEPLLSVIVPVYNVEQYLDRCIESITSQKYRNLEIIIVDDGSPDGCPTKCDNWVLRDNRIKIVHKKNAGSGKARNSGLEIASGEYVAFVDSDDYLDEDMYRKLMDEAIDGNIDCVYCGFHKQLPSGDYADVIDMDYVRFDKAQIIKLASKFNFDFSQHHLNYSVWHGVYRRSLIDFEFVSEREYMSEDIPFTHEFLRRCSSFVYLPYALYYYSYNPNSLSNTFNVKRFDKVLMTAGLLNDIYSGTDYEGLGNAYAFCQSYFLMRFSFIKSKKTLSEIYCMMRDMVENETYNNMLQNKKDFKFQKGLKYRIISVIYRLQRRRLVMPNFLALLLFGIKNKFMIKI